MSLEQRIARSTPSVRNRILILDVERSTGSPSSTSGTAATSRTATSTTRPSPASHAPHRLRQVVRPARRHPPRRVGQGRTRTFLKRVHALIAEADIIVGHYLDNADIPWLKGDFYLPRIGHPTAPSSSRSRRSRPSTPQGAAHAVQVRRPVQVPRRRVPDRRPTQQDRPLRPRRMERAVAGSSRTASASPTTARATSSRPSGSTTGQRPHIKNHPALFVDGQSKLDTCRACGNETKPIAKRYVADVMTYSMQRCRLRLARPAVHRARAHEHRAGRVRSPRTAASRSLTG
jgi:hypothetical protein